MARMAVFLVVVVAMIYTTYAFPENKIPMKCGPNEEFQTCGTTCEPSCIDPMPKPCNRMCKIGCQCKPGYLRNFDGGECVLKRQCLLRGQNNLP